MSDIFISHVEEDADIALEIALALEEVGYTTWTYEVDSIPGLSYLVQTGEAVEVSKVMLLVISPHSLGSRQVTSEVVRAHETNKIFIPLLRGITHAEFQNRQPEWREAVGATTSIRIPQDGSATIIPRIINGLKTQGVLPSKKANSERIIQIHKVLDELQGRIILEKDILPPIKDETPATETIIMGVPSARAADVVKKRSRWIKPVVIASSVIAVVVTILVIVFNQAAPPSSVPTTGVASIVTFSDSGLDAVVRSALKKQADEDIILADLATIANLEANQEGITDLTGIEHCVNLKYLNLNQNYINDISPLSSLNNLITLVIQENQISDISPLSSLVYLSDLFIGFNYINDISPLSSLHNLTTIYLGGNQINDISPLSSIANLTELDLGWNNIRDISPLFSLTNLTVLKLWSNHISDLSPLSFLTNLTELDLHQNQISDISPLSGLTNLSILNLDSNRISDISPLASLTKLTELSLKQNPLNAESVEVYIPQLVERGVKVYR